MKKPLVSVVVPAYQAENLISQCIESILNQTYENLEILIVNDGSTDRTGQICDDYAQKDDRIRVFHKENGGVSSARNMALANATGEYVVFCDSDDTMRKAYVEILLKNALENDCQVSYCGHGSWYNRESYETEATPPPPSVLPFMFMDSDQAIANMLIGYRIGGCPWGCLVKRSLLEELFFDTSVHLDEDHLFAAQFLSRAEKICSDKTALYNYYGNPNGVTHAALNPKQLTAITACEKIESFFQSIGRYEKLKEYIDARFIYCTLLLLRRCKDDKQLQKRHGARFGKTIRKHLNRKSLSHLARSMQISALVVSLHYKLYFFLLQRKS